KFVGSVDFKNVSRIEVEVVVVSIDVVVGIREVIARGFVRKPSAVDAFLALDGETRKDLPLTGQAFHSGQFDAVVRVVVQNWNIGDNVVERAIQRRIGWLETIERQRLVR